jgi:ABC-type iron transport system FetAB permease component
VGKAIEIAAKALQVGTGTVDRAMQVKKANDLWLCTKVTLVGATTGQIIQCMKTLSAISYAILAMVAIKFMDDVVRAEPTLAGYRSGQRR